MNTIINEIDTTIYQLQFYVPYVLMGIGVLFLIHFVNWIIGYRLNILGVHPRKLFSLPGIVCYPFLHSHFNHLFFNSIPLFVLASFVLLSGLMHFLYVSSIIIIISGLGIWLVGRRGVHVGASGLIMGYWSYLIVEAYQHTTITSVAPAIICLYYFGGFLFHIFPTEVKSSWEAHLFGFLGGITAAYMTKF